MSRRFKGIYPKSTVVSEDLWRGNAPNWFSRWVGCLCTHAQFRPPSQGSRSNQTPAGWFRGASGRHIEPCRDLHGEPISSRCSNFKWFNDTIQVFYDPSTIGVEYWEIVDRAAALPKPITVTGSRLVVHIQTSPEAVEDLLVVIKTLKQEIQLEASIVPSKERLVDSNGVGNVYARSTRPFTATPRT